MRSHPYTPAPPLPPLLDHLSTYLPNAAGPRRRPATAERAEYTDGDDGAVALVDLDPATSRLLPRPRHPHRVRVQGRLAVVRSVSVANLRGPGRPRGPPPSTSSSSSAASGLMPPPRHRDRMAVRPSRQQQEKRRRRRRRSLDDGEDDASEEDEAAIHEVRRKDAQLRSYGIGGAGNIRRPTDVIGTSTREPSTLASLFSSPSGRSMTDDKRWHWASFLGRVNDRKGKGTAHSGGQRRPQ